MLIITDGCENVVVQGWISWGGGGGGGGDAHTQALANGGARGGVIFFMNKAKYIRNKM